MTSALRLLFLLCGIGGLVTGAWSNVVIQEKDNGCPKGWRRLDCNCYIFQTEARTFADAESICNILGGNLVSIHSALENAFATEIANSPLFWIGFHDTIEEGDFIWIDGTEVHFLNFGGPEPNADGDCVVIARIGGGSVGPGQWADGTCTTQFPYICKNDLLSRW